MGRPGPPLGGLQRRGEDDRRQIPVLNVLSDADGWTEPAKAWLATNAPNSETFVLGLHLMFWEFPDQFNAAFDAFLDEVK